MAKNTVYSKNAPEPIGPYSQAIKFNNLLFTSGQIPIVPKTGNLVVGGIKEQGRQTLENLKAVIEAGGSDLSKVIKVNLFLANMDDFAAMNEVYAEYFGESKPARSALEASKLPKGALVEIDAIAFV